MLSVLVWVLLVIANFKTHSVLYGNTLRMEDYPADSLLSSSMRYAIVIIFHCHIISSSLPHHNLYYVCFFIEEVTSQGQKIIPPHPGNSSSLISIVQYQVEITSNFKSYCLKMQHLEMKKSRGHAAQSSNPQYSDPHIWSSTPI